MPTLEETMRAKYGATRAERSVDDEYQELYGAVRLSRNPREGYTPERPRQERHPDITMRHRAAVKSVAANADVARRFLEQEGFEVQHLGGLDFALRRPGEREWRVLDPSRFELADVTVDIAGDIARGVGYAGGAALGAPGGLFTGAAGGAAGGGLAESVIQRVLGPRAGLDTTQEELSEAVGREMLLGAGTELGLRAIGAAGRAVRSKVRGPAPARAVGAEADEVLTEALGPGRGAAGTVRLTSARGAEGRVRPRGTPQTAPPVPEPPVSAPLPAAAAVAPQGPVAARRRVLDPQSQKVRDVVLGAASRAPGMEFEVLFVPRGKPSELAVSLGELAVPPSVRDRLLREFGGEARFRAMRATLKAPSFLSREAVDQALPQSLPELRQVAARLGVEGAQTLERPALVEAIFRGQQGVVLGTGKMGAASEYGLLRPFDLDRQQYRHIPWDQVVAFRPAGGAMSWFRRGAATKVQAGQARIPRAAAPSGGTKPVRPPVRVEPEVQAVPPPVPRTPPGKVTSRRESVPQPIENRLAPGDDAARVAKALPEGVLSRVGPVLDRFGGRGASVIHKLAQIRRAVPYGTLGFMAGASPQSLALGYLGLRAGEGAMKAISAIGRRLSHQAEATLPQLLASQSAPPAVKRLAHGALETLHRRGPRAYRAALFLLLHNPEFRAWAATQGAEELEVEGSGLSL